MSRENPLWGASRIHGELLMLGFEVAQSTVSKYMVRPSKPPSQTWKTFLQNHAEAIAGRACLLGECLSHVLVLNISRQCVRSSINLPEHDVERADDGRDIGEHVATGQEIHR